MKPDELLEHFRKSGEADGFYLHADPEHVLEIAENLLETKNRYGYLSCPCRLSSGVRTEDADIICPCEYREADVQEFGACYCHLFVDAAHKDDPNFFPEMDDRRPPEKAM